MGSRRPHDEYSLRLRTMQHRYRDQRSGANRPAGVPRNPVVALAVGTDQCLCGPKRLSGDRVTRRDSHPDEPKRNARGGGAHELVAIEQLDARPFGPGQQQRSFRCDRHNAIEADLRRCHRRLRLDKLIETASATPGERRRASLRGNGLQRADPNHRRDDGEQGCAPPAGRRVQRRADDGDRQHQQHPGGRADRGERAAALREADPGNGKNRE
jgi:hypothetical protein